MRLLRWLTALLFVFTLIHNLPAVAQDQIDAIKVDPQHHKVVLENAQVRVVRWQIPVGDKTLNHSHPNSVIILLTDYNGKVTKPGRQTGEDHFKSGSVMWRDALIHIVENTGKQPMEGLIVEPKKPASVRPAGAQDPLVVDPKHHQLAFENEQIRVIREHYAAGEKLVMHGHPDNVQVILTDMKANLTTPGGESTVVTGKAGEVRWRTATQHAGQILDKPFEQVIIEMKGAPAAKIGASH